MKELIVKILQKALKEKKIKINNGEIESFIEIPPSPEMGDYAFPCFFLADKLNQEPHEVALEIREKIGNPPVMNFEDIQVVGPYINFFLNRKNLARKVVWEVLNQKENFGKKNLGKNNKVIVEFSSPNIGKPFGIGHLRSTIIGNSIANICEFHGFKVIRINYLGDWGTQFGKLILGYLKFGNEEKLHEDPAKHLLEVYTKITKNTKYDKEAGEWFKKLEQGDEKAVILWRAFKELSLNEFKKIYRLFSINFDEYAGESDTIKDIEKTLKILKGKRILKKSKGALIVNLNKYNLGVSVIQKNDGTTIYALRDLAAAIKRYKKYKFKKMIYEVGQEQKLYFKQMFKILELMNYEWAENCVHVDHGFYLDKDGKRFATRKGKTVFMQDILDKTTSLAKKEIKKRTPKISEEELEDRTLKVAIAAIFYGDLKNNRSNNMIFDIKRFVSFEGDTGPYILYSYARASSILRKVKNKNKFEIFDLKNKEVELVKKLLQFVDISFNAYKTFNPSIIANYAYQLAQVFNEFYHTCPVINSKQEAFRLALVESFRQVLRSSLKLLGIKTLEEM